MRNQDRSRVESGIRRELRGALAHYAPPQLTLVGKSRGTFALQIACTEEFAFPDDTRMIWLTPVWRYDEAWRAACANTIVSLHVVGLADREYHEPERHAAVAGETVAIADADHPSRDRRRRRRHPRVLESDGARRDGLRRTEVSNGV